MDEQVRTELAKLYAREGQRITTDAVACETLLRGVCGERRKEIAVLTGAVKCGIPAELTAKRQSLTYHVLRQRLIKEMEDQGGYAAQAAGWAIDAWRSVLETSEAARPGVPAAERSANPQLPPPDAVMASFRARKSISSPEANKAREYVRRALASGKKVEAVKSDMIASGYSQPLAEAVIWTASLSEKRGKLITEGLGAFGIAFLLIIASAWTGLATGATVTLGGAVTLFLVIFGCVRLLAAFSMPNYASSYRQVLTGSR